ncbi:MAG TPA: hypothetical protein VG847_07045 [Chitinophagaceae bacterium]|nr:hypothetical protein [Chitinophagaceae bacterium]
MAPLVAGLLFFKYLNKESRIIFLLVIIATVPQVLTAFIAQAVFLNTLYNIYTPVEFVMIYLLFGRQISYRLFKSIRMVSVVVFLGVSVPVVIIAGIGNRFLNEWVCAANLCYVCWIFLFILQGLLDNVEILDSGSPMFWYLAGLIFYAPATALVFSFYYSIGKNSLIKDDLWVIHDIFNTFMYIFFAAGMYKNYRNGVRLKRRA